MDQSCIANLDDVRVAMDDAAAGLSVLSLRHTDLSSKGPLGLTTAAAAGHVADLLAVAPLLAIDLKNCHITDGAAEKCG